MNIPHNQHKHLLVSNRVAFMIIGVLEAAWAPACTIRQEFFCNRRGYSWATYAVQWIWLYLRTSAFWLSCKSFWRKEGGLCFGIADGFRIVSNKPAYKYMADRRDAYGFWKLYHHH